MYQNIVYRNIVNQGILPFLFLFSLTVTAQAIAAEPDCSKPNKCKALDLHNQVRKDLNAGRLPNSPRPHPPVQMLVYDKALARTAYNWSAAQCNSRPGHNRKRRAHFIANGGNPAYPTIGENIYYYSARLPEKEALARAVASWTAEATQYRYRPFKDLKTGHYSQLIWNSASVFDRNGRPLPQAVGCGVYYCPRAKFKTIVTCNYAPAGNIYKQLPYQTR